jgi:predicted RNA-binding Zn-ribbon protein involved in translation (DUF1610 family)
MFSDCNMFSECIECGGTVEDEDEFLCPTCTEYEIEEDKARAREVNSNGG